MSMRGACFCDVAVSQTVCEIAASASPALLPQRGACAGLLGMTNLSSYNFFTKRNEAGLEIQTSLI